MADKSNILASLMMANQAATGQDQENNPNMSQRARNSSANSGRLTAGSSTSKQHKLKSRFTVIKKLGKGTYGKVQLAINKETGQEVAIKTIKKTKIENEQDLQRVRREIQIMSSIEHPHIIHIYEVFENKDKIVLVMQYAPGGELYEYVSQSKVLDDAEARRLFRQIATAIYYCHQNKICHRDLKLENILLDEKNNAKLADFGLSNVFDKRRQLKTFCGSPLYASPEIVQGSPYEGPEVDCWSLGVLLYTLVYGAMPFDGSNFKRLVQQISEACYYEPQQRSQASNLIRNLLCADPSKRANILDICADPWVNGVGARVSSPDNQSTATHTSLLKVAQDMANLTPVRLDILLALKSSSPTEVTEEEEQQRHPLAVVNPNAQKAPSRPPRRAELDPQVMAMYKEAQDASPVASYVVRDLENTPEATSVTANVPMEVDQEKARESEPKQTVADKMAEEMTQDNADHFVVVDKEEPAGEVDAPIEMTEQKSGDMIEEPVERMDDTQLQQQLDENQSQDESSQLPMEIEMDKQEVQASSQTEVAQSQETLPVAMQTEGEPIEKKPIEDKPIGERSIDEKQIAATQTEEKQAEGKQTEEKQTEEKQAEEKAEGKPKKVVKKKVVLVKKKKKVAKSEPAEGEADTTTTNEPEKRDAESDATDETANKAAKTAKKAGNKGPGKLKIPDTFIATTTAPEETTPVAAAPSKSGEGRRQSTLVADISQKLLTSRQSISAGASEAAVRVDQPQLVNVNVSGTKDELERRASLAKTVPEVQRTGKVWTPAQIEVEPERVQGSQESLNVLDGLIQQIIIEPVDKIEPIGPPGQLVASKRVSVASEATLMESEPMTPTANGPALDGFRLDNRLSTADASPRDDRSDSAETIKPESLNSPLIEQMPQQQQPPRSLKIDIPEAGRTNKSAETSIVAGPAPIARSYKKVTFTKDGACITETGKVYSAKGDDGTIRRIERKSKVTHYPSDQPSATPSQTAREECHEELIYEDGGPTVASHSSRQSSSSFMSRRPFERLIMPSTDFMGGEGDQFTDEFLRRSPFARNQQQQRPQVNRADSMSSCSSGSTDVFEDIFDTWTGAISMFNRVGSQRRSSGRQRDQSPMMGTADAFSGIHQPMFGTLGRRRGRHEAGSQGGTPRFDEGQETPSTHRHRRGHRNSGKYWRPASGGGIRPDIAEGSGYESDATFPERPATSLGSARGIFGSSNLHSHCGGADDPFARFRQEGPFERPIGHELAGVFGEASHAALISRNIELEHEKLRQRLTQQHRNLWRGSTPSLFEPKGAAPTETVIPPPRPPPPAWQPPRPPSQESPARPSSGSGSGSGSSSQRQRQSVVQSASGLLRQSTALHSAPIRRNTASLSGDYLPPRQETQVRQSMSRASVLTNQLASMRIDDSDRAKQMQSQQQQHKHSASFIELKRTSSGTSQQQVQQHRTTHSIVSAGARPIDSNSEASSAFWDERATTNMTSANVSRDSRCSDGLAQQPDPLLRENMDSRIQSWLQESSGNLSTSSGFKSSASDAYQEPVVVSEGVPITQSSSPIPAQASESKTAMHSSSAFLTLKSLPAAQEQQLREEFVEGSRRELKQQVLGDEMKSTAASEVRASSSRATVTLQQRTSPLIMDKGNNSDSDSSSGQVIRKQQQVIRRQHHQVLTSTSSSSRVVYQQTPPSSSAKLARVADPFANWAEPARDDDGADSNSGGAPSSADLESQSSSSLLDQLRSRGYRSMINQRMVSESGVHTSAGSTMLSQVATTETTTKMTTTASVGAVEESTRIVSSSASLAMTEQTAGGARIIKQQRGQLHEEGDFNFNVDQDPAGKYERPSEEQGAASWRATEQAHLRAEQVLSLPLRNHPRMPLVVVAGF